MMGDFVWNLACEDSISRKRPKNQMYSSEALDDKLSVTVMLNSVLPVLSKMFERKLKVT